MVGGLVLTVPRLYLLTFGGVNAFMHCWSRIGGLTGFKKPSVASNSGSASCVVDRLFWLDCDLPCSNPLSISCSSILGMVLRIYLMILIAIFCRPILCPFFSWLSWKVMS